MLTHLHPSSAGLPLGSSILAASGGRLGVRTHYSGPPSAQSRFAGIGRYPKTAASRARCQKALPSLHRSYRLMRQTKTLPRPRFVGLYPGSLQVVASPCWELALPDVISTVCVKALGPIPRRVRPVHLPVSSRTTSASPYEEEVRHAKYPLHYNFSQGSAFRGCSHSLMFRLLNLLDLQVVPTAGSRQGSQAFYTTQDLRRYRTQVVASLRTRLGQLVRRDLHPRDCMIVGCYPPRSRFGLRPSRPKSYHFLLLAPAGTRWMTNR